MEQELAGLGEGQVAQFIEHYEVHATEVVARYVEAAAALPLIEIATERSRVQAPPHLNRKRPEQLTAALGRFPVRRSMYERKSQ